MKEVFIKKEDLGSWITKYFKQDLISIDDLISVIEDLDSENDDLKCQLEELERDIEENYKPIPKADQYEINDSDFI